MNTLKVLIVCGPTATGKTSLGIKLAQEFNGEIVSADSRQVYKGMDIVTGKDLPPGSTPTGSNVSWQNSYLQYYLINKIKIWGYDLVSPDQEFSVSHWRNFAQTAITHIHKVGKLPVVVGGTGLYIKSLLNNIETISIPPNNQLRHDLSDKSSQWLFNYLKNLNLSRAENLNESDRKNPRRLIRQIELSQSPVANSPQSSSFDFLSFCLSAPQDYLVEKITEKINTRIEQGAEEEARKFLGLFPKNLPSLTSCGYNAFTTSSPKEAWITAEKQYAKRQLTWFKKQANLKWINVTTKNWYSEVHNLVSEWYNFHSPA